ncbi:MAG: NADH-quinone oxidoreductase subunit C [Promethearchaeota archaeon]
MSKGINVIQKLKEDSLEHKFDKNTFFFKIDKKEYLSTSRYLKEHGFKRLLTVSAVDWIEDNLFEVYFIVHNMNDNIYIKVATFIPRKEAKIESLHDLWPNATLHEREGWEMFGILFEGNEMLKPFFLENWNGPPPFRKDFDWREYVMKNFNVTMPTFNRDEKSD